ncbi:MAG: M20/M25/M40 family metallo-hydrolase [Verrucomicrobia bacterium]|nr:M20/M25/M40 family metallo-hydrolase [Verrucomicrobiota bacterium]
MNRDDLLAIIRPILECPTAPTFETAVRTEIENQLKKIRGLRLQVDSFGNLIAWFGDGLQNARYAFVAHMDHPGWELKPVRRFLGGVPEVLRDKCAIRDFGNFGMWDLPALQVDGSRLYSRACDDLVGCAAIVATLKILAEENSSSPVVAVFTRAEEVGFIGAIRFVKSRMLASDTVLISLETSAERLPAKMGDGPIIRVGDRVSVFDPAVTDWFARLAEKHKIRFQRCLMPGGTCEATAFQLYGYRAAALCIALGNYHNCTPDGRIDSEFVDLDDFEGLVRFCQAIAREDGTAEQARDDLRKRLEARLDEFPLG